MTPHAGLCMDARELARWEMANGRCRSPVAARSPCRDCTAAFSDEMRFEGRCSGRPGSNVFPVNLTALQAAARLSEA